MWLSGQHKRPADSGEGQTGTVTMSSGELAVMLESERRGLELYAPAGYRWTPRVGQRVLVIRGQGEIPCVVGARSDGDVPDKVEIQAETLTLAGTSAGITGEQGVTVEGERVDLNGQVYVNGEKLEDFIARIVAMMMGV